MHAFCRASLPADLDAFFPANDGRQVLIHEQDFGLKRHLPAFRAARRAAAADPKAFYPYAQRALRLRPDFVWSRVERLELLGGEGQYREALKDANLLLRRYPREAWAWAQRHAIHGPAQAPLV